MSGAGPRIVAAALILLAACNGAQTPVTPHVDHGYQPPPRLTCNPAVALLGCSLDLWDGFAYRDTTAAAIWSLSDPSIGEFVAPGRITPKQRGIARVQASYGGQTFTSYHSYYFEPGSPVVTLFFLWGYAYEEDGKTWIWDVRVEITSGEHNAGKSARTDAGYYAIDDFWMGEPFTVRASKPGYQTVTITHAGIDENNHGQNFFLKRIGT